MTKRAILSAGLLAAAFTLLVPPAFGQNVSGSLSATVYDASNAVVPNAKVVLTNEATNTTRETVSNDSGFFTISAIQPGSYTVSISARGFAVWERRTSCSTWASSRALPAIALQVGGIASEVHVVASAEAISPVDNGEGRQTLNGQW
jgi:hypothetical protein